ncbi:MAG: esterase/lipase family protein [Promethearchaeota archaeon]
MRLRFKKRKLIIFIILILPLLITINSTTLKAQSSPAASQNPILFIHGWTGSASAWNIMKDRFYNDGWSSDLLIAISFSNPNDYSASGNIQNAEYIKYWVNKILNNTSADNVDIIAHSMGGISSRYYLKFLGGLNKVDDYVCLGSPHHGVLGGTKVFQPNCTFLNELNNGDETPGGILNDTIGPRLDVVGGGIYNSTHTQGSINYTSIFSSTDTICSPYTTSILDGAHNILVSGIGHVDMLYNESFYTIIKNAVYDDLLAESPENPLPGYKILILWGFSSISIILIIIIEKFKKIS